MLESQLLALFKMLPFRFVYSDLLMNLLECCIAVYDHHHFLTIVLCFCRLWCWSLVIGLADEFTLITPSVFLLILVLHGKCLSSCCWLIFFWVTLANCCSIVLSQAARSVQRESSGTSDWETRIALVSY